MHLGPDELTRLTKKERWLEPLPEADAEQSATKANATPILPTTWTVNPLYQGAQAAYVGDAQAATAAELGEFDDILVALQDELALLELEEDLLIVLAGLGIFDDWTLVDLKDDTDPFGVVNVSQSPPHKLSAADTDSGTLSMYANGVFLGMGPFSLHTVWQSSSGMKFGSQIQVPFQMYHVGHSPYCQVTTDSSTRYWRGPDSTSGQSIEEDNYKIAITASGSGTVRQHGIRPFTRNTAD
ncbi:hypothetical protein SLS61_006285 [Didymella pomorum]